MSTMNLLNKIENINYAFRCIESELKNKLLEESANIAIKIIEQAYLNEMRRVVSEYDYNKTIEEAQGDLFEDKKVTERGHIIIPIGTHPELDKLISSLFPMGWKPNK
jgi:hypothetical protein